MKYVYNAVYSEIFDVNKYQSEIFTANQKLVTANSTQKLRYTHVFRLHVLNNHKVIAKFTQRHSDLINNMYCIILKLDTNNDQISLHHEKYKWVKM